MRTLKYMANDCDNDSIVVSETTKTSFYAFLDSRARKEVFKEILEFWTISLQCKTINVDQKQENVLKKAIIDTFTAWLKLALPNEVFEALLPENPTLIELVFCEVKSKSDENLSASVSCIE